MVSVDRFRATYLNECAELLSDMEARLVSLDGATADSEQLNAIFRCAHSIKGGAGAFGFSRVSAFTHKLEALLDDLREGRVEPHGQIIATLLKSVDVTIALLHAESQGETLPDGYGDDVAEELLRLGGRSSPPPPSAEPAPPAQTTETPAAANLQRYTILFVPHEGLYLSGNDPLVLLRELMELGIGEVKIDTRRVPHLPDYNPEQCYLGWEITLDTEHGEADIRSIFEFVEDLCDLKITAAAASAQKAASASPQDPAAPQQQPPQPSNALAVATPPKPTDVKPAAPAAQARAASDSHVSLGVTSIRVDLEKIDRLVDMVGELVITQAMLQMQTRGLPVDQFPELLRGVDELSQHMRELQEAVMSVRMQPVKSIFSRMPRIVHDIAQQLGKDIRLIMVGENTEVDKTIIEQLADPLTHMIRNAADHGIETPQARQASGKTGQGTIILSAANQGGHIIIEVSEDGAGLNREKILAKARQKGLVAEDAVLSDEAVEQLIFLPGFSTADTVSNISGRGVGMDVVRRNIEAMGGTVQVRSMPGKGTNFTVMLPLTLAILDGMIVKVGNEKYIIPIANIIESMRPPSGSVRSVPDGHDVLNVRGEFIPVVYLGEMFGIDGAERDPSKALVVLVECGAHKIGMVVDELLGQQQVVIKSLEANADHVDGVSGATILGDGRVSLIVDVVGLGSIIDKRKNFNAGFYKEAS